LCCAKAFQTLQKIEVGMNNHLNGLFYTAIVVIVIGLLLSLFPAKFGKGILSLKTKMTLLNESNWKKGQKLNALLYIAFGSVELLYSSFDTRTHALIALLILIWLFKGGLMLIEKILQKKSIPQDDSSKS
jgi:hypothetical protein